MTQISIDLGSRYAAAFGLLNRNNVPGIAYVSEQLGVFSLERFDAIDPDFENVKFKYDGNAVSFAALPFHTKQDQASNNALGNIPSFRKQESLNNVLAPPVMVSFSGQKAHIETPVNDSDNVVIERWGTKPWEIRMRGLLIDVENRHYPESRITALYKLFKYNGVVEVSGTQFFDKDIASIFFTDVEITGVQGYQDTVQFSLQAKSIAPVEFTLLNP